MNYDLAIMALDGMMKAPMTIRTAGGEVVIEGDPASFKELARLCLLLGGTQVEKDDAIELLPGTHVTSGSPRLVMKLP
jgi:hypothetical protein